METTVNPHAEPSDTDRKPATPSVRPERVEGRFWSPSSTDMTVTQRSPHAGTWPWRARRSRVMGQRPVPSVHLETAVGSDVLTYDGERQP